MKMCVHRHGCGRGRPHAGADDRGYLLANYDDVDLNGDGAISYVMFKGQNANPRPNTAPSMPSRDCDAALEAAGKPALTFL